MIIDTNLLCIGKVPSWGSHEAVSATAAVSSEGSSGLFVQEDALTWWGADADCWCGTQAFPD